MICTQDMADECRTWAKDQTVADIALQVGGAARLAAIRRDLVFTPPLPDGPFFPCGTTETVSSADHA
jgi:hypothetical protein